MTTEAHVNGRKKPVPMPLFLQISHLTVLGWSLVLRDEPDSSFIFSIPPTPYYTMYYYV